MKDLSTLCDFLDRQFEDTLSDKFLSGLLKDIAIAGKHISQHVQRIGLFGVNQKTGQHNIHGEEVNSLDLTANNEILFWLEEGGNCAGVLSEECSHPVFFRNKSQGSPGYICLFDPLDGSSNIGAGISLGSIFSIVPFSDQSGIDINDADFCNNGTMQLAAAYLIYGSSTIFVYAAKGQVNGFTLDPSSGEFYHTHVAMTIPADGSVYSFNYTYLSECSYSLKKYIDSTCGRNQGVLENPATHRYTGTLVSDFHRSLIQGGIFMSPETSTYPRGKLRLLYECAPLAFIVETAGGCATNGEKRILEIEPEFLHQRTPFFAGSSKMMASLQTFLSCASRMT